MSTKPNTIQIRLKGTPTDDGRLYVTSPDLKGFHFLLEKDEEPLSAMKPALVHCLSHLLEAQLKEISPLVSVSEYRAQTKARQPIRQHFFPKMVMAEVAA